MKGLNFLLLAVLAVAFFQLPSLLEAQQPLIVQPAHTLPDSGPPPPPGHGRSGPRPGKKLRPAPPVPTTTTPKPTTPKAKGDVIRDLRDQILKGNNTPAEMVQHVRDHSFRNAFHEAIDEKIVDPNFIQTLASVDQPPLVNDYTRDTLLIDAIREDLNFTFGENVFWWETLETKKGEQHVIVGLSDKSIVILLEHFGEYKLQEEVPMETVPRAFDIITVWESAKEQAVSCLVIATEMELIWYTLKPDKNFALTEEWRWPLYKEITLIKCFTFKDVHMILLIGTHPNKFKSVSATLYEFNFEKQQFWLLQRLDLAFACSTIGLVQVEKEFLVAFPQNDTAMIYTLEAGEKYRGRFNLVANYTSEMVHSIGAFRAGRYAYIAIGGRSPQIVRYADGQFASQQIPMDYMETVEAYFEIPTPTYRDDLILLVQHKMEFSTHELQRLDIFVWNGESFDLRSNIPCYVEDDLMDNEVSCMLDLYRPTGIVGSAIIKRGKTISMIVPRFETHSTLFHVDINMLSAKHPITQKVQEMRDTIEAFTKIIEYQDIVINEALAVIAEVDVPEGSLIVLQNCSIGTIETDIAIQDINFRWPDGKIEIGNLSWTYEDTSINVPAIAEDIELAMHSLDDLEAQMKYTVRRDNDSFSLDLEQPLHVEGQLEIGGSLVTDDLYVRQLEEEPFTIRVLRQAENRVKELHLKDLKVRHLNFEMVNGIPASDLVFNTGDKIELHNKIIFQSTVTAQNVILPKGGTVNGVDLSESTVYFNCKNRRWDRLKFESLEVVEDTLVQDKVNGMKIDLDDIDSRLRQATEDTTDVLETEKLILDGSLYFRNINGVPWTDIIHRIVMKNRPYRLAELAIDGKLILQNDNVTVYHLNGLAFPSDYLLSRSPTPSIVTGFKRFVNTTYIDALDVEQTVNDVDLSQVITLRDDQHIPGNVTFGELHVTERLEVVGAIRGKHLDEFLDNPTLLKTQLVTAACHFQQLYVDGPVIVQDQLNDFNVDDVLADVVYDTEHTVTIEGPKKIGSVEFQDEVTVTSGMINEFALDRFVTKSTEQEFDVTEIVGNAFFQNLELDGLFDGLNATALDQNCVKLFGDQYTEASLIFKNRENQLVFDPDVEANELRIMKTLNFKTRSQYLDTEAEELVFSGQLTLKNLNVKNLHLIDSVIDGPSKTINTVHLPTFDNLRFSLTRPQNIPAPFHVDKLIVSNQLYAAYINARDFRSLKENINRMDHFRNNLLQGIVPIENLYIGGNLQVNMLNDVNFDALLKEVIWLNRPNRIPGTVRFLDTLLIEGNMTVQGPVNKYDFKAFLDDAVLKSEGVPEFHSTKVFVNGLNVEGNLDTESINNIFVKDFALRNQTIFLRGNVEIFGGLKVNHLNIEDRLNGEPIQNMLSVYSYDETKDLHVVRGDMYFYTTQIHSLHVRDSINQIRNVDAYLAALIRKDQDYNFTKPMVFKNDVHFENGLTINYLNKMDISSIAKDIVRINEVDPVQIDSTEVVFEEPVYVEQLTVKGDLVASNIAGCNPDQWLSSGIMINRDVEIYAKTIFASGAFQANHIQVQYINGQPTSRVITLNTDQAIETSLLIDEMTITQPLEVGGYVNGISFPYERKNTLMTYGTQRVRIPTVFNSVRVTESLTLPPILNGKPFGQPVVIGPQMVIESPVTFHHVSAHSVETEDMISGVDFNQWYEQSLWSKGRDHQVINAQVTARVVHFKGDMEGNGKINGVDIKDVVRRMKAAKKNVEDQLQDYRKELRSFCSTTKDLVNKTQIRTYFFKYFVQRQVINKRKPIVSFHFFDHLNYHFLAINMGCETHFYQWDPAGKSFVPIFKFHTGFVEEWKHVVNGDSAIYLVTRSFSEVTECQILGISVWLFTGVQLQLMWNAPDVDTVQAVASSPNKPLSFFVLEPDMVVEHGIDGSTVEHWKLPKSAHRYKFVPNEVGLGLALSDGKLLVLLSNVNKTETVEMGLFAPQSLRDRLIPSYLDHKTNASYDTSEDVSDTIQPDMEASSEDVETHENSTIHADHSNPPINGGDLTVETVIARDIPVGGILTSANSHFPEGPEGEIIGFHAGPYDRKRHLVAVSVVVHSFIQGDHDAIKIYTDIQAGKLYQVLPCHRPSHLTTLELRDETIIAFLEALHTVQVYIYRGMQGFVRLSHFKLSSPAIQLAGVSLPQPSMMRCKQHYLAIATQQQELVFLKAKAQGDCGLAVEVECDDVE